MVHRLLPDDGEVAGLLALMLLTDARRPARTGPGRRADPDGRAGPQPLGRRRTSPKAWPSSPARCPAAPTGPYQLQAAIAAIHDEAPSADGDRLAADRGAVRAAAADRRQPGGGAQPRRRGRPWSHGPDAGLELLDKLDSRRADRRGPPAVRGPRAPAGDGRRRTGRPASAYQAAARRTTSLPQQRYLHARAARLIPTPEPPKPRRNLPADSENNRDVHYENLCRPLDPAEFIANPQEAMRSSMTGAGAAIAENPRGSGRGRRT